MKKCPGGHFFIGGLSHLTNSHPGDMMHLTIETASWRVGGNTQCAEQDNRVRIPDGTAAVCADVPTFGESQSLGENPGKAVSEWRKS